MLGQIAKTKPEQETETTFERHANSELPVLYSTSSSSEKFILAVYLAYFIHPFCPAIRVPRRILQRCIQRKALRPRGKALHPPKYSFDADVGEDLVLA